MIGTYTGNNGVNHGFLDRHEVFTTFNVPGAGTGSGQGTVGAVINNHGVIAGIYIDAHGVLHGYLGRRGHFTTIDHPYAAPSSIRARAWDPSTTAGSSPGPTATATATTSPSPAAPAPSPRSTTRTPRRSAPSSGASTTPG